MFGVARSYMGKVAWFLAIGPVTMSALAVAVLVSRPARYEGVVNPYPVGMIESTVVTSE